MAETMAPSTHRCPSIVSCKFGWPTTYEVRIDHPAGSQVVTRRYTDFQRLRDGLLQRADTRTPLPELPPKGMSSVLFSSARDDRQEGLSQFLVEAFSRSALECEPWYDFLGISYAAEAVAAAENGVQDVLPQSAPTLPPESLPAVVSEAAAPGNESGGPPVARSDLDEIRELRRQRWRDAGTGTTAPAAASASVGTAGVASSSSSSSSPSDQTAPIPAALRQPDGATTARFIPPALSQVVAPAPPQPLSRLSLLPLQELPPDKDEERLQLLREALKRTRDQRVVVEAGLVLEGQGGFRFCVIRCSPDRGFIDSSTVFFTSGPVLPRLERVQFIGLRQHGQNESLQDGEQQLFANHVAPHFRSIFADTSRCGVVCLAETPQFLGVNFEVSAITPEAEGWGIVDRSTQIFTSLHPLPEFTRIHVVPFSDTLPSAYDFDVFNDYVKPFFACHQSDSFQEGQAFRHNGVQFKVVAAEPPRATCRVGSNTQIFSEGRLHPSAAELLTPDESRQLAIFPPGLQILLLQTNMFGNGDVADRIIEAQSSRSRARLSASILENATEEIAWSQERAIADNNEQTECIVCLSDFETGCRVRVLPCKHMFHTACIDEWLGRDAHCPLCRTGLQRGAGARRRPIWG